MRHLALALAGLALGFGLACGGLPVYETPDERGPGSPVLRANQPHTGELTWRPATLRQTPDGVFFEFTLVNGSRRTYYSVMLRIVLRGPDHALATVRYPAGGLAAGTSRRVRAQLAPPGFAVEGADLELIYAQE